MKKLVFLFVALVFVSSAPRAVQPPADAAAWERQAQNITIVRDDWGIAHIHGKTDADAVFGMIYAQAEDDFNRVETNYLNSMGRLAEAEGEGEIYRDLRMKLFIDPVEMKALYQESPEWLKALMNAWADGLNYYLHRHPEVKPRVITRFEPWMALTFSEGSIGGDIERVNLNQLEAFYGKDPKASCARSRATTTACWSRRGSNGFAIAPGNTAGGPRAAVDQPAHVLLLPIRGAGDERRRAQRLRRGHLGAVLHLPGLQRPGGLDAHFERRGQHRRVPRDGSSRRATRSSTATARRRDPSPVHASWCPYKTAKRHGRRANSPSTGRTTARSFARSSGKWVERSGLMQDPLKALIQSYTRTKATNYKAFRETMELHTNSSNNTIFADADGNIAYFHSNFIPRRDTRFDWTKPVDGSDPATEWKGVLSVDETPGLLNPGQRLALQHQQLAVDGGRAEQPEEGGLSSLRRERRGEPARRARYPRARRAQGLQDRLADRRRLRQLLAGVRGHGAAAREGVGAGGGFPSNQGAAGRADRNAAQVGLPVERVFGRDDLGGVLG